MLKLRISVLLVGLTTIAFLFLTSSTTSADTVVNDVSITVPVSCNLSSGATVDEAHSANVNNGTYKENIGTTTFKILCNDNGGFSVYAIGYSGEEYGKTDMIATVNNTLSPTHNIPTGLALSGDTSSWAMKLIPVEGTYKPTILSDTNGSFGDYHVIPNTYTKVATLASNTDFTNGSSFQTTYRAYVSRTQPVGSYTGKVRYVIVHPNDATAPTIPGLLSITNMQDMTPEICAASTVGDEKQLIDSRDGKSYWVAKLADGGCWMTQNLDHDIDSTKTYTPNDTDIPANWTPDKSTYATNTTTWDTSTNGYNIQQSYDPGNKIWNGGLDSSANTNLGNMTQGTDQHYHLGNYYNWGAAVAMNNTSSYTTQYIDVNQSICPKGWMLPKSGNITAAGSFQNLVNQYNWASDSMTNPNMWADPLYFPLAGAWRGSSNSVAYLGNF